MNYPLYHKRRNGKTLIESMHVTQVRPFAEMVTEWAPHRQRLLRLVSMGTHNGPAAAEAKATAAAGAAAVAL